ncbi:MAG TPA: transporter [Candidatus Polarisedimenticolia bacterium]|nr:transporter [Candidatus Polarisedimenticolia bacterium]
MRAPALRGPAPGLEARLGRFILIAAGAALLAAADASAEDVQTFGSFAPGVARFSADSGVEGNLASIPITLGMRVRRLSLRASVPYLDLSARTPEIPLTGPILGLSIPEQSYDRSGIGDVVFTPAVLLAGGKGHSALWGSVRAKFPTADEENGLGTGQFDYAPGLGVLVPLGTRFTAGAMARYDVRGDTADIEYEDHLAATVGGTVRIGLLDALTAMVSRGDVSPDRGDPVDTFSLAWYHPFVPGHGAAFTATALTGLGGDPQTLGLSIGVSFNDGPWDWGR